MIKGLYSAFSALESAWKYQDVLANNIANANTVGFKREVATSQSFADALLAQQSGVPAPLSSRIQSVVGQIGTGKFLANFTTDYAGGAVQPTGNELDLATDRGFFAVQDQSGQVFYTRDGRFGRDANGDLVTSHGLHVLDSNGGFVTLPETPVTVGVDGTISGADGPISRLRVLEFAPADLKRAGEAYFKTTAAGETVDSGVRQGTIEMSNANLVEEMTSLLAVQRTYQANQTVLARLDGTLDRAAGEVGQFGR